MRNRPQIPDRIASRLLAANNHTCCICETPRKNVQIHHIDGNARNNIQKNLAVVCLDCHSRVSGDEGLGRRFTATEVTLYKKRWESKCKDRNEDEDSNEEEPEDTEFCDFAIGPMEHKAFEYSLEEGDLLLATIVSDEPVDTLAGRANLHRRWCDDKEVSLEVLEESCYEVNVRLEAPRDGDYVIWVHNADDDNQARVQIDIAIWQGELDEAEEE